MIASRMLSRDNPRDSYPVPGWDSGFRSSTLRYQGVRMERLKRRAYVADWCDLWY